MVDKSEELQDIHATLEAVRADYWRGLEQVEGQGAEAVREVLVVRLGAEWFALPSSPAREVLRVPRLVRVPGAADHIAGIISLRGEILAVTDPRVFLGLPAAVPAPDARLVLMETPTLHTALLVDEVRDLRTVAEGAIEPPQSDEGVARPYLLGRVPQSEGLVTLLDVEKMLSGAGR